MVGRRVAAALLEKLDGRVVGADEVGVEAEEGGEPGREQAEHQVGERDAELLLEVERDLLHRGHVSYEDGRHHHHHEHRQARHVPDEEHEKLVVEEADAVVEPRAKVVHLEDAPPEHAAVVRAVGLVHVRLRLPTHPPRPVVLRLERLQLRDEGAHLRVLRAHDPRVRDAAGLGEDGAHEGDDAQREEDVERDAVSPAERLRALV
mmetsp:Transcript_24931/g.42607  ORF Transcript_24931/g.42607 Transcript_24931/m.42607 type:complete len:205 (-) Transcript_24931:206-820(-)